MLQRKIDENKRVKKCDMVGIPLVIYSIFTNVPDEIWKPHPLVEGTFLVVLASAIVLEHHPKYRNIVNFWMPVSNV
jgi:hypothetical protein